jgi:hypothetical protein
MANVGDTAESDFVYMAWHKSDKKYVYLDSEPTDTDVYDYIGKFKVKIETVELEFTNPVSKDDVIVGTAKQFTGYGYSAKSDDTVTVAKGYIPDAVNTSNQGFYNSKGTIQYPSNPSYDNAESLKPYSSMGKKEIEVKINREYITRLFKWLTGSSSLTFKTIKARPYTGSAAGNMILSAPTSGDTIHFYQGSSVNDGTADSGFRFNNTTHQNTNLSTLSVEYDYSNSLAFASSENVFVQANLDVTPKQGNFNSVYLVGKNIIINGNIELYVYCVPDTSNQSLLRIIFNTYTGRYGMGKVLVGVPVSYNEEDDENVLEPPYNDETNSGILDDADFQHAGKIFFGGNVTVTIEIANEGKHRYRLFNAGDVYYYDAEAEIVTNNVNDTKDDVTYGIDLLQYFLENAIAHQSFGTKTLDRFRTILQLYYSEESSDTANYSPRYVISNGYGRITYDAMYKIPTNEIARYPELVPPSPADASGLVWTTK